MYPIPFSTPLSIKKITFFSHVGGFDCSLHLKKMILHVGGFDSSLHFKKMSLHVVGLIFLCIFR